MTNYSGNREAFLFVYLSKADDAAGRAAVAALERAGYRLYLAQGFAAKDARALNKAAAAVLLMSSGTLNELSPVVSAAAREDKPLIPVYLDRVELPAGMRMLLGPKQAHARPDYADDAGFAEALLASPVLRELRVTAAQKKAARGLLIGAVAAAVVIVAAVLLLTLGRSAPAVQITGATLTELGLSGDAGAVERVYLYGAVLRDDLEENGAQDLNLQTEDGAAGVYLPKLDQTVARGTLRNASDFAQLVNLKELALSGNAVEDASPLWTLTQLARLDLSCNLGPISLEGISALEKLESLNVAYCEISGGLAELERLPGLQTLTISSDYLEQTAALSARGVRVLCPSVKCADWETLQTWAPYEHVYELIFTGDPFTIPEGERLIIRKNVHFGSELGSTLDNYGTVELYGTWEMGMTKKNNYGSVTVRPGGLYSGGMGDSHTFGDFTVDAGGVLEIDRGEQYYLEGGTLTVNGTLRLGGGGSLKWNGGTIVNNGTIRTDAAERYLDEMLGGRLADIRGDGTVVTGPEEPEETAGFAPVEPDAFADLPNDPTDLDSLDEYGMTPRERAYYDAYEFRSPTWSGGSVAEALVPYADGDACMVTQSENATAYLARSMTLPHQPLWFDGFAHLVVAPGATVTLGGDDWNTSLALTVLPGGTLIVDGDVMFQMAYNSSAGTVIVNGRLYAEAPSWGNKWGMFGNSGTVIVNGAFAPSQLYRFAGAAEEGEIDTEEIFDMTDMAAPLQFAHGYHGMWQFAIFYDHNEVESMWWLEEDNDRIDELPNDPEDVDSLDEYGMTPRERAWFDTVDFRYPVFGGSGSERRPLTPYTDAEKLMTTQPVGCEAYLARDMTVTHQPHWADGFAELFIGPGATATLCGDDWHTSLAITVLPGATCIIEGDVMFQMAYNAGTLIVNGRLYGERESNGIRWGMFGNSGTVTVHGTFAPCQFFRFAGAEENGEIGAEEIIDMTDMEAPVQFANGYHSLALLAQMYDEGNEAEMWWKQ